MKNFFLDEFEKKKNTGLSRLYYKAWRGLLLHGLTVIKKSSLFLLSLSFLYVYIYKAIYFRPLELSRRVVGGLGILRGAWGKSRRHDNEAWIPGIRAANPQPPTTLQPRPGTTERLGSCSEGRVQSVFGSYLKLLIARSILIVSWLKLVQQFSIFISYFIFYLYVFHPEISEKKGIFIPRYCSSKNVSPHLYYSL